MNRPLLPAQTRHITFWMANSEQSPPERRRVMRFLKKEIWRKYRKRIILVSAGVAAVAVGCGIWYYMGHNSADPVYVYPFEYVGMTEYWGDSQESNGPVTTDKIQTVFLSDTQTVTEILVKEKDTVKKGDILMTFDTTLSDLQLERKRLDVEKLKLQLESAQKELKRINGMQPMVIPTIEEEPEDT
jgi:multidrug efflux pump subunit AcrA (membrane-fusion protein)